MNLGKEIKDEIESKGKKIIKMKEEKLARTNKIGGSEPHQPGRIMTSIEGLDKMLKGGLLPGRNVLLSGPCGSGKTTIAMQFVCNGAILHNEKSLYVTLEEKKEKIVDDMKRLGMDIEKAQEDGNLFIIGGPIASLNSYMHKVDASIDNIIKEIEDVVRQNQIKRVSIDSINLLTMLLQNDEEKRLALASLCNTLSSLGCTSLLLSETKEHSMDLSRYGMEEFVVDGVIVLYLVRQGAAFVPGIVVRKMRGVNHDKEIKFYQITDKGVIVYPEETLFAGI